MEEIKSPFEFKYQVFRKGNFEKQVYLKAGSRFFVQNTNKQEEIDSQQQSFDQINNMVETQINFPPLLQKQRSLENSISQSTDLNQTNKTFLPLPKKVKQNIMSKYDKSKLQQTAQVYLQTFDIKKHNQSKENLILQAALSIKKQFQDELQDIIKKRATFIKTFDYVEQDQTQKKVKKSDSHLKHDMNDIEKKLSIPINDQEKQNKQKNVIDYNDQMSPSQLPSVRLKNIYSNSNQYLTPQQSLNDIKKYRKKELKEIINQITSQGLSKRLKQRYQQPQQIMKNLIKESPIENYMDPKDQSYHKRYFSEPFQEILTQDQIQESTQRKSHIKISRNQKMSQTSVRQNEKEQKLQNQDKKTYKTPQLSNRFRNRDKNTSVSVNPIAIKVFDDNQIIITTTQQLANQMKKFDERVDFEHRILNFEFEKAEKMLQRRKDLIEHAKHPKGNTSTSKRSVHFILPEIV